MNGALRLSPIDKASFVRCISMVVQELKLIVSITNHFPFGVMFDQLRDALGVRALPLIIERCVPLLLCKEIVVRRIESVLCVGVVRLVLLEDVVSHEKVLHVARVNREAFLT